MRVAVLLSRLLLVVFYIEVGLLLLVLPWSIFWDRNYFVYSWPAMHSLFASPFLRGAVSGVGVLNLVSGFGEMGALLGSRQ